jgi:putative effector of murein hydrolase LrgA (UPF0299 family)
VSSRKVKLLLAGAAVAASQAGHLLAYEARFGTAANALQSTGAHGYFPVVVKAAVGVACMLGLTGLFAIGLARALGGRRVDGDSAPQYVRLLAVLFTMQLAVFAGQEVAEALAAGVPVSSVGDLLLWGTLGQLPVALVAAAALRWLLARFESAVSVIRVGLALRAGRQLPAGTVVIVWPGTEREPRFASAAGRAAAKRGPPSSLRLSVG